MIVTATLQGGLGNNLFQIATVLGYSMRHGINYCIPTTIDHPHYEGQKVFFLPNINYCDGVMDGVICNHKEPFFHYQELSSPQPKLCDWKVLHGYFQSSLYFDEYREEILRVLNFKWEQSKDWVSLHYRAGNYRKFPDHHPVISEQYIDNAIFYFSELGYNNFMVFSDEIGEVERILSQDKFKFAEFQFKYVNSKSEVEDLELMSGCEHQICANSSFSWWAYYLNQNPNKIGVFPAKWFGSELAHDTKDLYPKNAIIL